MVQKSELYIKGYSKKWHPPFLTIPTYLLINSRFILSVIFVMNMQMYIYVIYVYIHVDTCMSLLYINYNNIYCSPFFLTHKRIAYYQYMLTLLFLQYYILEIT